MKHTPNSDSASKTEPRVKWSVSPGERRYVSLEVAAEILGCHHRTVRRLVADGTLTGYRVGKRLLRLDLAEVQAVPRSIPTVGGAA